MIAKSVAAVQSAQYMYKLLTLNLQTESTVVNHHCHQKNHWLSAVELLSLVFKSIDGNSVMIYSNVRVKKHIEGNNNLCDNLQKTLLSCKLYEHFLFWVVFC